MNTYIYTLADPFTGSIKYVGKANDPAYRYKTHFRKENTFKSKWFHSKIALGKPPVMEILDCVPIEEWKFWEQHWIQVLKGWGFSLVNGDNGGLGHQRLDAVARKKISDALSGRPNRALFKAVSQYTKDGVFIRTFESFQDAARYIKNNHANISRAIRFNKTCGGYRWAKA